MPLNAGDSTIQPGTLSRAFYDALGAIDMTGESDAIRRSICAALAAAVVDHITANANVVVPAESFDGVFPEVETVLEGAIE